jgi:hypothetical protein
MRFISFVTVHALFKGYAPSKIMQAHISKLLQIVDAYVEQYQMFKDESTVTRILLEANVDSLMSVVYKEYNDLTMEVRQTQLTETQPDTRKNTLRLCG